MIYAQHFSQEEFREWAEDMSPRLITMLDVLRFRLGSANARRTYRRASSAGMAYRSNLIEEPNVNQEYR